jgi:uncharacterized protein YlxW (UPF0749 family)
MLQKLKITTCAFILCLFGLTLMIVSSFSSFAEAQSVRARVTHHPKLRVELDEMQAQIAQLRAVLDQLQAQINQVTPTPSNVGNTQQFPKCTPSQLRDRYARCQRPAPRGTRDHQMISGCE